MEKGLTKEYYKRVKKEISETNEAIKKGVMKGADVKRIPDFQEGQRNKSFQREIDYCYDR